MPHRGGRGGAAPRCGCGAGAFAVGPFRGPASAERQHPLRLAARALRPAGLTGACARPAPCRAAGRRMSSSTMLAALDALEKDVAPAPSSPPWPTRTSTPRWSEGSSSGSASSAASCAPAAAATTRSPPTCGCTCVTTPGRSPTRSPICRRRCSTGRAAHRDRRPGLHAPPAGAAGLVRARAAQARPRPGRDVDRLCGLGPPRRLSPLGAGALAGSSLPLDPQATARELGFDAACANSIDAVSDRDFVAEFGVRHRADRRPPVTPGRGGGAVDLARSSAGPSSTTRGRPGRRSCRRRRTRTSPSSARGKSGRLIGNLDGPHRAQGSAFRLQPRPAGGQGAGVRRVDTRAAAARGVRHGGDADVRHRPHGGEPHRPDTRWRPTSPSGSSAAAWHSERRTRSPAPACARATSAASSCGT